MSSKQSEAVRRYWTAARLAMEQPDNDSDVERPDNESWGDLTAEPGDVDYIETDAGGLAAIWAAPKRSAEDRVLLCIHGGGFVSGSIYSHRKMFGHLAKATGARALDPATIIAARETLRLALIASLQYLPPRQRAVLILRDVLGFPAAEVATMLDTTAAAVKSHLQRARARLDHATPTREKVSEPTEPHARTLLDQYVAGFENADTKALEQALRTDAAIEMVGTRTWFSGRVTCLRYLTHVIGAPGDWRMIPTAANGQPAAAAYHRDGDGVHHAFGLAVLTVTDAGISRILVFGGGPNLVARFGLPPNHPGANTTAPD